MKSLNVMTMACRTREVLDCMIIHTVSHGYLHIYTGVVVVPDSVVPQPAVYHRPTSLTPRM